MKFFRSGGAIAWILIASVVMLLVGTTLLGARTAELRFERDVSRMVFNDNVALLESIQREVGAVNDSLDKALAAAGQPIGARPYLVISIADHRLWYKVGDSVLFTTQAKANQALVSRIPDFSPLDAAMIDGLSSAREACLKKEKKG